MSAAAMARAADAAYEAIRTLNHETLARSVAAPEAYDVLGNLQQVGFALDQLTRQLGAGLVRSLTTHDVYDDKGDPAKSVALAVDSLLLAGQHARRVGECLTNAQAVIAGQGNTGVKEARS
ncbi:hypothetical protein [Kribbella italica]|uniref:Uncharacterized protein n=1 Tax=Kribbella italica TaxID=1540520 RepID=A0A7W9JCM9_9ACTN|nr:hypothetical protein [Kribbella italica]MBB5839706.1 hypothetical protein [Kribbella italica]